MDRGVDNQNVVYPYSGILLISKKEWTIDTCYHMQESHICNVKWKKSDWKAYYMVPFIENAGKCKQI